MLFAFSPEELTFYGVPIAFVVGVLVCLYAMRRQNKSKASDE
jgi:hypothetical protein